MEAKAGEFSQHLYGRKKEKETLWRIYMMANGIEERLTNDKRMIKYMTKFSVREKNEADIERIKADLCELWGSESIVTPGTVYHDASQLHGYVAEMDNEIAGVLLYQIKQNECEIVELYVSIPQSGIGKALIHRMKQKALHAKCKRIWTSTASENTAVLKFYQKQGFYLINLYIGFMEELRKLKPDLPKSLEDGTPLQHHVELEYIP